MDVPTYGTTGTMVLRSLRIVVVLLLVLISSSALVSRFRVASGRRYYSTYYGTLVVKLYRFLRSPVNCIGTVASWLLLPQDTAVVELVREGVVSIGLLLVVEADLFVDDLLLDFIYFCII